MASYGILIVAIMSFALSLFVAYYNIYKKRTGLKVIVGVIGIEGSKRKNRKLFKYGVWGIIVGLPDVVYDEILFEQSIFVLNTGSFTLNNVKLSVNMEKKYFSEPLYKEAYVKDNNQEIKVKYTIHDDRVILEFVIPYIFAKNLAEIRINYLINRFMIKNNLNEDIASASDSLISTLEILVSSENSNKSIESNNYFIFINQGYNESLVKKTTPMINEIRKVEFLLKKNKTKKDLLDALIERKFISGYEESKFEYLRWRRNRAWCYLYYLTVCIEEDRIRNENEVQRLLLIPENCIPIVNFHKEDKFLHQDLVINDREKQIKEKFYVKKGFNITKRL